MRKNYPLLACRALSNFGGVKNERILSKCLRLLFMFLKRRRYLSRLLDI